MNDMENTSGEESLVVGNDEKDQLSCGMYIELSNTNNLTFDVVWNSSDDLVKLATLINAITTTDFIMNQIRNMETDDSTMINQIETYVSVLNSDAVISPLEVCKNASKSD